MVCDSVENGEDLFNSGLRFRGGPINLVGDGDGGEVGGVTGCGSLFTKEVAVCPNTEVSSACGEFRKDVVTVPCGDKSPNPDDLLCPRDTPLSEDNGVEGDFPCPNCACPSATMASFSTLFGVSGSNILTKKDVCVADTISTRTQFLVIFPFKYATALSLQCCVLPLGVIPANENWTACLGSVRNIGSRYLS